MSLDQKMEHLAETMGQVLSDCLLNKDFKAPLHVVVIGSNGAAQIYRCEQDRSGTLEMSMLSEHVEGPGFLLPINIIVTDSAGRVARLLIEDDGTRDIQALQ